jgi:hypothetical protein
MLEKMTTAREEFSGMAYRAGEKKKTEIWPTPTSSMMTVQDMEQAKFSGTDKRRPEYKDARPMSMQGQLSAEFVEWLMGYPLGYTDIDQEEPKYGKAGDSGRTKEVCLLRKNFREENYERESGRQGRVSQKKILQPRVLRQSVPKGKSYRIGSSKTRSKTSKREMRNVRRNGRFTDTSFGWKQEKHDAGKFTDTLYFLSYKMALESRKGNAEKAKDWLNKFDITQNPWHSEYSFVSRVAVKQAHRVPRLKCLGNAVVPQIPWLIFMSPAFDPWRE